MIEPWIENPDEESIIIGRTQACDFIGQLEKEWHDLAIKYRNKHLYREANIFEECKEMLEAKIESFAQTK